MPEYLLDILETRPAHQEVARGGVLEGMEPAPDDARALETE
jgi:hypothetical protein